jgi:ABC-type spermidine/putrescine transport system permease subunit I
MTITQPMHKQAKHAQRAAVRPRFAYIWLPFMILPVYTALERIPDSLIEASGDLGARNPRTLRAVVLPLALRAWSPVQSSRSHLRSETSLPRC